MKQTTLTPAQCSCEIVIDENGTFISAQKCEQHAQLDDTQLLPTIKMEQEAQNVVQEILDEPVSG